MSVSGLVCVRFSDRPLQMQVRLSLLKNTDVKGQIVALQENDIGYDEERLKRRLGVKSLRGADLSGVDLRWLYLQETDLAQANLQGANLKGTNLRKANLRGPICEGQIFPVQT